jgi:hypothetical protein
MSTLPHEADAADLIREAPKPSEAANNHAPDPEAATAPDNGTGPSNGAGSDSSGPWLAPDSPEAAAAGSHAVALAATNATFALGQALGGPDWAPIVDRGRGVDEPGMMYMAWRQYCAAVGLENLPPWLGLGIAMSAYAAPRLSIPTTRSRLARLFSWLRRKRPGGTAAPKPPEPEPAAGPEPAPTGKK